MNIPSSINLEKLGPIKVFEDDTHFLVHIHPENRDRAKKIFGRQWDGDRKVWVYPKDPSTFDALAEEFRRDADIFDIQRPKTKQPTGIKPPLKESDHNKLEAQFQEEISPHNEIRETPSKIHTELGQIRVMLESLRDDAASQTRTLEEVRGYQEEARATLIRLKIAKQSATIKKVAILPDNIDLDKQKEVELIEKTLIRIAYLTTGNQNSFLDWISKHHPLSHSSDFVTETHEFLKKQLGKIVGDEDCRSNFASLIQKAKDEDLIYIDSSDPTIKPIPILFTMNTIRNRFGHPNNFNQGEKWNYSILYLMNLALIWSKIVIEAKDNDE